MLRRVLPALLLAAVLAAPGGAAAQNPERTVVPGVTAGGVDLGGLTLSAAQAKLEAELAPKLERATILGVAGRPWRLTAAQAGLAFDSALTAKRALYADAAGPVPVAVTHSRAATRAFVADVARRVDRAARNATVRITLRWVSVRGGREGRRLDQAKARALVDGALDDAAASRVLHLALTKVRPARNYQDVRAANRTVLTVSKATFTLRLFKDLRVVKTYKVATGQPAYPTPSGLFRIQSKQVNPTWSVPNSPWAGELAGTTVQGGSAANPLKARWMGIVNGVGIHGTGEVGSIGTRASHGCLRMRVPDVIALYRRVPVGTPILIK